MVQHGAAEYSPLRDPSQRSALPTIKRRRVYIYIVDLI